MRLPWSVQAHCALIPNRQEKKAPKLIDTKAVLIPIGLPGYLWGKSLKSKAPLLFFRLHRALVTLRIGAFVQARSERLQALKVALAGALLTGAMGLLSGCAKVTISNPDFLAAISAPSSTIRVNQQIQLVRASEASGAPLTYSVNGVQGGNAELGTVDSNGLYTAPAIVPVPNSVIITSVASNYPTFPPGSVTLAVWNPIPVLNTVTPSGFAEGTTMVTVARSVCS